MPTICIRLDISADKYLAHYGGVAQHVLAKSLDGRTVQFPASVLRKFITKEGIHGYFMLEFDHKNRFQGIRLL